MAPSIIAKSSVGSSEHKSSARTSITRIFNECQRTSSSHRRSVLALSKMNATDPEGLLDAFMACVNHLLLVYKREPAVERAVAFVVSTCSPAAAASEDAVTEEGDDVTASAPVQAAGGLGDKFAVDVIRRLVPHFGAKDKAVRLRSIQIVGLLLKDVSDGDAIDEDLWDALEENLLERAWDKLPAIRTNAVLALDRLQNPTDPDDVVTKTLLQLMGADSSPQVRKTAVHVIVITKPSVAAILARTRDTSEDVRTTALKELGERVHIKSLKRAMRADLLGEGLQSRDEHVRSACEQMVAVSWLKTKDGDLLDLLAALDPEAFPDNTLLTVRRLTSPALRQKYPSMRDAIANAMPLMNLQSLGDSDALKPTTAMLFRALCEHAAARKKNDGALDELVPDVLSFCEVLKTPIETLRKVAGIDGELDDSEEERFACHEFALKQLLGASLVLDLSGDDIGRSRLLEIASDLTALEHADAETVLAAVKTIRFALRNDQGQFIRHVVELISSLQEGEDLVALDGVKSENQLSDVSDENRTIAALALDEAIVDLQELTAQLAIATDEPEEQEDEEEHIRVLRQQIVNLKESIGELEMSMQGPSFDSMAPWRGLRCLQLTGALLAATTRTTLGPELAGLLDRYILPAIQSVHDLIRLEAVKSLALYCCKGRQYACEFLPMFKALIAAEEEDNEVRLAAIRAVFDVILLFGTAVAGGPEVTVSDEKKVDALVDGELENGADVDVNENEEAGDEYERVAQQAKALTAAAKQKAKDMDAAAEDLVMLLLECMDANTDTDTDTDFQACCASGFAKLFLTGRLGDARVLQCLMTLLLHPQTEGNGKLRQTLTLFFRAYVQSHERNWRALRKVAVPFIRSVMHADEDDHLADLPLDKAVNYVMSLLSEAPAGTVEDGNGGSAGPEDWLCGVAEGMLKEIAATPYGHHTRMGAKLVAYLPLKATLSQDQKDSLRGVIDDALDAVTEDTIVTKLIYKLQRDLGQNKTRRKTGRSTRKADVEVSYVEVSDAEVEKEQESSEESDE